MCKTCGCSPAVEHHHDSQPAGTVHEHRHESGGVVIRLEQHLLAGNQELAEGNRAWLAERAILALNLLSSPGAGKTTLLERTIRELGRDLTIQVIEGDQATDRDARRIAALGCRTVQINTGSGCHLDAGMVLRGLQRLDPPTGTVVLIENVGNLVCPALFDLGEQAKVVVCSVTEGEDKPIKYPHMFRAASILLLSKIDLLPHVEFNLDEFRGYVAAVNPRLRIVPLSARSGEGMAAWYDWLHDQRIHEVRR